MRDISSELRSLAERVLTVCRDENQTIAIAESCTGGLISAALTAIPGSSDVVECGFVTYSNAAKQEMLGVPAETINTHGAVSREVAGAMARGAFTRSNATIAISVTGVAGPGQSENKPAGLVYVGLYRGDGDARVEKFRLDGDRDTIRQAAAGKALSMILAEPGNRTVTC